MRENEGDEKRVKDQTEEGEKQTVIEGALAGHLEKDGGDKEMLLVQISEVPSKVLFKGMIFLVKNTQLMLDLFCSADRMRNRVGRMASRNGFFDLMI